MPPENLEPALQLRRALSQGTDFHGGGVYTIASGTEERRAEERRKKTRSEGVFVSVFVFVGG